MHCSNIYQQVVPKFGGSKWKTWSPKVEVKDLGMSQNARNMRGHKFLAKAGRKHLQGCVLRKPVGSPRNTQNLWNQGCPFRCKKLRFSSHPRKTVSNLRALLEHSSDIDKDKHGWQLRRYHGKLVPCTLSPCNLLGWSAIRPKLSASITMVSYKLAYNHIWSKRLFKHATES